MKNIGILDLPFDKVVIRFYVMMVGSLILGFMGFMNLAAIWGGLIAFSAILGISFKFGKAISQKVEGKIEVLEQQNRVIHKTAV